MSSLFKHAFDYQRHSVALMIRSISPTFMYRNSFFRPYGRPLTGSRDYTTIGARHPYSIAYCTCPNAEVVDKLSSILLEKRLAACVSSHPVTSQYVWKGLILTFLFPKINSIIQSEREILPFSLLMSRHFTNR